MTQNRQQTVTLPIVNVNDINPHQSTHNEHVELTIHDALIKLKKQYPDLEASLKLGAGYHEIFKEGPKLINQLLYVTLEQINKYKAIYEEIYNYFGIDINNPNYSPPKFSPKDPPEVLKLKAAKRSLFALHRSPEYYSDAIEALPYVWRAIHDEQSLVGTTPEKLMELFIQHLYEIQRGRNLIKKQDPKTNLVSERDDLSADGHICPPGTVNKLVHTLHGYHPSTNVVMVSDETMYLKFFALVKEYIIGCIKKYIETSDENKKKFYSSNPYDPLWEMPDEIKDIINGSIGILKKEFYDEFVPYYIKPYDFYVTQYLKHKDPSAKWDETKVPETLKKTFTTWDQVEVTHQDIRSKILNFYDPPPLKHIWNLRDNGQNYGTDKKYLDFLYEDFSEMMCTDTLPDIGCELFLMPSPFYKKGDGKSLRKSDRHHIYLYINDSGGLFYSLDGVIRTPLPQELQPLFPDNLFPDGLTTQDPDPVKCEDPHLTKAVVEITSKRRHTHPATTTQEIQLIKKLRAGCQPQPDRPLTEAEKQLYMDQMITNAYYLMRQDHFLGRSALADEFKEMINSPKKLGFGVKYGDFFRVPSDVSGIAHGPNIARPTLVVDDVNKQKRTIYITERQQQYFVLESMALVNKKILHQGEMSLLAMIGSFKNFMKAHYPDPLFRLFEDSELDKYNELIPNHLPMNEQQRRACEKLKMQLILCDLIKDKKLSKANVGTLLNLHDLQKRMVERPFTATVYQLKLHLRHLRHTDRERLKAFIARIEAIGSLPSSEQEKYELLKNEIADTRVNSTEAVRSKVNCLFSCFASSNLATALKEFKHQVVDKLDKSVLNNENNGNNVSGPSDMFDFDDGPSNNPIVFPEGPDQEDDNHNLNLDM